MKAAEAQRRKDDRTANYYEHYTPPATRLEEGFRHTHWRKRREKVKAALARTGSGEIAKERFSACGSDARVEWNEEKKKYRIKANYCHHRHCEPCAKAKANRIAANLKDRLEENPNEKFRFITLTQRSNDAPLAQQIATLYRNFKKLRNTRLWKQTQVGGAFFLEVKRNGNHWHAHLHVIAAGAFIRVHELSAEWMKVTGDSFIVDVRLINSANDAAFYVTKYLAKGTSPEVWLQDDTAEEWITASKGVRTCATYGTWRGFKLMEPRPDNGTWTMIEKLDTLISRSLTGDAEACAILKELLPSRDDQDAINIFNPD